MKSIQEDYEDKINKLSKQIYNTIDNWESLIIEKNASILAKTFIEDLLSFICCYRRNGSFSTNR